MAHTEHSLHISCSKHRKTNLCDLTYTWKLRHDQGLGMVSGERGWQYRV